MRVAKLGSTISWIAFGVLGTVAAWSAWYRGGYTDFQVYYRASERLLAQGPAAVYTLQDGIGLFRYSPAVLGLFAPWALLPFEAARVLWVVLQWLTYGAAIVVLGRMGARLGRPAVGLLIFWFLARPIYDSLRVAQVSGWMVGALALAAWGSSGFWAGSRADLKHRVDPNPSRTSHWLGLGFGIWLPTALKLGLGAVAVPLLRSLSARGRGVLVAVIAGWTLLGVAVASMFLLQAGGGGISVAALVDVARNWWLTLTTVVDTGSSHVNLYANAGSQSMLSAILRARSLWVDPSGDVTEAAGATLVWAQSVWRVTAALATAIWLAVEMGAPDRDDPGLRVRAMGVAVLHGLVWMPFTFKYALPLLALTLWARIVLGSRYGSANRDPLLWALALTVALPARDLIRTTAYNWLHHASIPALVLAWLWVEELIECVRGSRAASMPAHARVGGA